MKYIISALLVMSFGVAHAKKASDSVGGLDRDVNYLCNYEDIKANDRGEEFVMCTPVGTGLEAVGNTVMIPVEALAGAIDAGTQCGQEAPVVGHVLCGAAGLGIGALRGGLKTIFGIFE